MNMEEIDLLVPRFVNENMRIGDMLRKYPATTGALMKYGMKCVSCPSAQRETLAEAAAVHGYDVDDLVEYLNNFLDERRYMDL